jgi:hypothetical protein
VGLKIRLQNSTLATFKEKRKDFEEFAKGQLFHSPQGSKR